MTAGELRDGGEIEALVTDRYLESLLSLGLNGQPVEPVLPDVRLASAQLLRDAPRYHPSFRFEERVALRLAQIAATMRVREAAGGEGSVVPLRRPSADEVARDERDVLFDGPLDEPGDRVRPLLIGGALTSAALSIAGAAFVAWRRTRPASPMARAVREVSRGRLA